MGSCYSMFKACADVNKDNKVDFKDVKLAGEIVYNCLLNGAALIKLYRPLLVELGMDATKFDQMMDGFTLALELASDSMTLIEQMKIKNFIARLQDPNSLKSTKDIANVIAYGDLIIQTLNTSIQLSETAKKDETKLEGAKEKIENIVAAMREIQDKNEESQASLSPVSMGASA